MSRLRDYIRAQVSASERAEKNAQIAARIAQNVERTKAGSDNHLCLGNSYERQKTSLWGFGDHGFVDSQDPVVRKLNYIDREFLGDVGNKYSTSWAGPIRGITNDLLADIHNRTMAEDVYTDLLRTSKVNLVDRWVAEFEEKYRKMA